MLTTVVRPLLRLAIAALLAMFGLVLATATPVSASVSASASASASASRPAADCANVDLKQQVARADVVFVAKVEAVSVTEVEGATKVQSQSEYTLTATHLYKGSVERNTTVTTNQDTGLGELTTGTEYIFLATGDIPPYGATSCGGSSPASAKRLSEIEAVLGAGDDIAAPVPPAPVMTEVEQSAPTPVARLAAPGGALVLIGLLGLLVARRLTRT